MAAGHVPLDLDALGADYVSVSAHKLGGPPGTGALVLRRGLRLEPLLVGGPRSGAGGRAWRTSWASWASARRPPRWPPSGGRRLAAEAATARARIERLVAAATAVEGVAVVGDPDPAGRLPHLVCLGVEGVEAEPVVLGLDRAGVAVHSGSACSSEALEPSPVLEAMGVDPSRSLRLSVGWSTTAADVDAFAAAFPAVVAGCARCAAEPGRCPGSLRSAAAGGRCARTR